MDLTPLRVSPPFRRLWLGLTISNLGAQLTVVAVGLQVYHLTGSTSVGLLGLFALVPLVIFGLYGGAIVDHYDRRTVALVVRVRHLVRHAAARRAGLGGGRAGLVAVRAGGLQSGAFAVNAPARSAIIPRLLEPG